MITSKTDGIDTTKTFSVEGTLQNGTALQVVEVEAHAFDKLEWLPTFWGAKAQVTVGPMYKAHVAAAIKERSNPLERTVYSHTGWIQKNSKFFYLTNGGGIAATGFDKDAETELKGALVDYDLPTPNKKHTQNLSANLHQFNDLIDDGAALLIVGAAFRAPLSEFKRCTVSLFLQGTTGTFKSAIAGCIQAFFGRNFNGAHLPENWSSTANAIEKKASLAKDTLFTIDDFVARGTPSEVSRLHRDAERVLRAQGNQSGRDRLTFTTEIRGAHIPLGLILATGEDLPNGHSLQARCVILSIKKGTTNTDALSVLQETAEKEELAQLMSNFIQWVAEKADQKKIADLITTVHDECKQMLPNSGHTRMRDNLATLMSGLWLLLSFGKERANMTETDIAYFKRAALEAANKLSQLQSAVDQEASEADRFITILQSSLSMGRAHIANKHGECYGNLWSATGWKQISTDNGSHMVSQGPKVGWILDEYIYLDMKATLTVIKAFSNQIGNYLGSTERAISKALKEADMLAKCDKDRTTVKITAEGRRHNLLCLPLRLVIDWDDEIIKDINPEMPF